jgi:hypothetical protein
VTTIWLSTGSPTTPAMVNPLAAACQAGFVPTEARFLADTAIREDVETGADHCRSVLEAYGADASVDLVDLATETDYEAIVEHYRSGIEVATDADEVAVDITPGRKFMSALAFQAGARFGADHIYYFHRHGGGYHGEFYPEIPRTATTLVDFTEVL